MMMVQNFDVICNKFNVDRIYNLVTSSSQKENYYYYYFYFYHN
jgi:hypothetical protein